MAQDPAPTTDDAHERASGAWDVRGERDLYESRWVRLSLVDVQPPHGDAFEHHVITLSAAAMTAVLSEDHRSVALIWRHRFAPGLWNWELPGGLVDAGESPEQAARRELREELGLDVEWLHPITTFEPDVGMVRSPHHVFVAGGAQSVAEPTEPNEGEGYEWIALDSIQERIARGEIQNSGTLVALLHILAFGVPED